MVFENKVKDTLWLSCQNGKPTMIKKIVTSRSIGDEYNKIIEVVNTETGIGLNNRILFEIIFTNYLDFLSTISEDEAVNYISGQAEAYMSTME